MKIVIAAAFVSALAAQTAPVAAKPEPAKATAKATPSLDTNAFWRATNRVNALKVAISDAEKALKQAEEAKQVEETKLRQACGAGNALDLQSNVDNPDVICKPVDPPKVEAKK